MGQPQPEAQHVGAHGVGFSVGAGLLLPLFTRVEDTVPIEDQGPDADELLLQLGRRRYELAAQTLKSLQPGRVCGSIGSHGGYPRSPILTRS